MPKFLFQRWHGMHMIGAVAALAVLTLILFFYEWIFGIAGLLLTGFVVFYMASAEKAFRQESNDYILTLSHRVKRAGHEVIHEFPMGIVLFNEEKTIEWHNPYVASMFDRESIIGSSVKELFPMLANKKEQDGTWEGAIGDSIYKVMVKAKERLLYISDITEHSSLLKQYEEEKMVIGIVAMDNLDEVTQGMDEQGRSIMLAKVISIVTEWAQENHVYMRRIASDKFLIIMDQRTLKHLEQTKFEILDAVRDYMSEYKLPLTLSMGIASGVDHLVELGRLAQTSLDIALGRGGDQVAVKVGQRLSFYGGRSNAVEKRTRVRARVIAHALRDLIKESDKVLIMGHKYPDMDSVGAAIGVLKAVQMTQKEGYIVLEEENPSIQRMMEQIAQQENLIKWFIKPEQAKEIITNRSLVVVVDTHKATLVEEPKLLNMTHRIVVVDHHRRGEEFIDDALLVYLEPYASSTCELVTELLQYMHDRVQIDSLEATMLLSGMVVDTKSFSYRTGARTFEAASFLRRNGADSANVQHMLKEDLNAYLKRAEIIKNAKLLYETIALSVAEPNRKNSQLIIAQVADTLLNMTHITASFVVSERPDGLIGISARSLGQINVQIVMEKMGGGGHLTNAATQFEGTVAEAEHKLFEVLEECHREGLLE
jgi:c-di-AMP phosphodiesterase-like protein